MQAARDRDARAGAADREAQRLVALRRPVDGEAAQAHSPEIGGERLGAAEHVVGELVVVGAGRQRQVARQQRAADPRRALVAGRRERRARVGEEAVGGVRQRCGGLAVAGHQPAILTDASSSAGRSTAASSANSSGPAISGGASCTTGSPRSSARQISPSR